ncbi:MAG: helix-turn-helix domain-containing protein [Cellvibrionaceae bacterium]
MLTPVEVGQRIKQARTSQGMNQTQLAIKAGLSNSTISDIERGKLDPKISQASKICRVLGFDLNWLYGYAAEDLDTMIDSGELNIEAWVKFKGLNYEYRKRIYDEIEFLFDIQK